MDHRGPYAFPAGLRALVVDDHDLIRKTIIKVLRKLDFSEVQDCSNGKDAKAILDSTSLDLIICDIDLNYISGFELLDHVRSFDTRSDVPFIIVTGANNKDDIVKAADKGAEDYLVKPFQAEELEAKIVNVLNQYYSPGPILARVRAAEKAIEEKNWSLGLKLCAEALKIKETARARHLEALIFLKQKKYAEASQKLAQIIQNHPGYLKSYVSLANLYLEVKDPVNAINALKQELEINPKQPLRQIKVANLLISQDQAGDAIEHFRLALLENGRNAEALYGMGTAYALTENLEKAIYYFKRYRRNHPKDSKPLRAIVQFCEKLKQIRLAEVTLIDEKKGHPERLDTYVILAEFYTNHEKPDEALPLLEFVIKKKPTYLAAYKALANYYVIQNDVENALNTFQDYIRANKDPEGYIHLAKIFIRVNKFSNAILTLHQAMRHACPPQHILPLLMIASLKTRQIGKAYFIKQMLLANGISPDIATTKEPLEDLITARRNLGKQAKRAS